MACRCGRHTHTDMANCHSWCKGWIGNSSVIALLGMQVWFPTDRNMAGCDNCSFWVHDHCDEAAGTAIEFGDAVTYYCPQCRRQADAHHKLQVRPRDIADLPVQS